MKGETAQQVLARAPRLTPGQLAELRRLLLGVDRLKAKAS